jgi:hypothetical protein
MKNNIIYQTSIVKTGRRGFIVCFTNYSKHHLGDVVLSVNRQSESISYVLTEACAWMNL